MGQIIQDFPFSKGGSAQLPEAAIREDVAAGKSAGESSLSAKTEWVMGDLVVIEARNSTTLESLWRNPWDRENQLEPLFGYFSWGSDLTRMDAPVSQTIS